MPGRDAMSCVRGHLDPPPGSKLGSSKAWVSATSPYDAIGRGVFYLVLSYLRRPPSYLDNPRAGPRDIMFPLAWSKSDFREETHHEAATHPHRPRGPLRRPLRRSGHGDRARPSPQRAVALTVQRTDHPHGDPVPAGSPWSEWTCYSLTTHSPSSSRMYRYAGCDRRTDPIVCWRASSHVILVLLFSSFRKSISTQHLFLLLRCRGRSPA